MTVHYSFMCTHYEVEHFIFHRLKSPELSQRIKRNVPPTWRDGDHS